MTKKESPIVNAINNRDDAKRMDELLLQYSQKFSNMKHPDYLPLQKWWDKVQGNTEAGRRMLITRLRMIRIFSFFNILYYPPG